MKKEKVYKKDIVLIARKKEKFCGKVFEAAWLFVGNHFNQSEVEI